MRNKILVTLVASVLAGGCELIVRFDDPRGTDAGRDVQTDIPVAPDVPTDAADAAQDVRPPDDGGMDAPADAPRDAPGDAGMDVPGDLPGDALGDVPTDVPTDVPGDAASDVPTDVATDVPTDVATDVPTDVPTDQPTDAATDVSTDVPTDVATDVPTDAAVDVPDDVAVDAPTDVPGDSGPAPLVTVNGCDPTTATDLTAPGADRTVNFVSFAYTPSCIRVRAGQTVTWHPTSALEGFDTHPLRGGAIVATLPTAQPGTPIPDTSAGTTDLPVTFNATGSWGFYCNFHYPDGMIGAVHVVP